MPRKKPTVALFTAPEGHWSISQSLEHTLQDHYEINTYLHRDSLFDLYLPIYRYFPGAFVAPYELSKLNATKQLVRSFLDQRYEKLVEEYLENLAPDLLVSTYYAFNGPLEQYAQRHNVPFINVISDPRTFHPLFVAEGAYANLVFDQPAVELAQEYNPAAHTEIAGWFVRPDFQQPLSKTKAKQQLGLDPNKLTFFIASGSEGSNLVMKILPALFTIKEELQVIIACGSNKTLLRSADALAHFLAQRRSGSMLQTLGYTPDIAPYFHAADLIIGKAGPNTLFEAVATHTPFMAISHIAGQETGNLEIIREYRLGYVEENPIKAILLLQRISKNPDELAQWKPGLKKVAAHNASAPDILRTLCETALQ